MAADSDVTGAQVSQLSGERLHLHHGPIDIVFQAVGERRDEAERRAVARFGTVLDELVSDLPILRRQCVDDQGHTSGAGQRLKGSISQAMAEAVQPHAHRFVTPMAAVAGAVADAVLEAAVVPGLSRAYANNGGDAALWLAPGEAMRVAIGRTGDRAVVRADDPVRGVATSGWRGRSHSLGVADAVTVLARDAAAADVAATLIANAVDLPGSTKVTRIAACEIDPDSDLRDRMVTRDVGLLSPEEISEALAQGVREAHTMRRRGLIHAAVLYLGGRHAVIGGVSMLNLETCDG